jgi:hypothetical protein
MANNREVSDLEAQLEVVYAELDEISTQWNTVSEAHKAKVQ